MNIDQKFPCVADLKAAAARRVPYFAFEYLTGGIGRESCLARNRSALDNIILSPQYLISDGDDPNLECSLLGNTYDLPFGIAPIGFSGLIWPKTSELLALAAKKNNIPCCLSTFATASLEEIRAIASKQAWFQLYPPKDAAIRSDLLKRARESGYETLIVTVDIPVNTRRDRDIRNGLSVPPRINIDTLLQILARPRWTVETLLAGVPEFKNLTRYLPSDISRVESAKFLTDLVSWHISPELLTEIRAEWKGKLIIKGVLSPKDAAISKNIGVDALIVSNHGGRQLDAAPSAVEVMDDIRKEVGPKMPLIADGGVRNGLDIVRMLAKGADFVLMGRPFVYAVAALGAKGGDHAIKLLKEELKVSLAQLGCASIHEASELNS